MVSVEAEPSRDVRHRAARGDERSIRSSTEQARATKRNGSPNMEEEQNLLRLLHRKIDVGESDQRRCRRIGRLADRRYSRYASPRPGAYELLRKCRGAVTSLQENWTGANRENGSKESDNAQAADEGRGYQQGIAVLQLQHNGSH